nr:MAG TPA: hypothetical protein [Caudoviricetes sp.]
MRRANAVLIIQAFTFNAFDFCAHTFHLYNLYAQIR